MWETAESVLQQEVGLAARVVAPQGVQPRGEEGDRLDEEEARGVGHVAVPMARKVVC